MTGGPVNHLPYEWTPARVEKWFRSPFRSRLMLGHPITKVALMCAAGFLTLVFPMIIALMVFLFWPSGYQVPFWAFSMMTVFYIVLSMLSLRYHHTVSGRVSSLVVGPFACEWRGDRIPPACVEKALDTLGRGDVYGNRRWTPHRMWGLFCDSSFSPTPLIERVRRELGEEEALAVTLMFTFPNDPRVPQGRGERDELLARVANIVEDQLSLPPPRPWFSELMSRMQGALNTGGRQPSIPSARL